MAYVLSPEQKRKKAEYARQRYLNKREEILIKQRAYYYANKEDRLAFGKRYYYENKKKALAVRKAWRTTNSEHFAALTKKWRDENPIARRAIKQNYRSRELNADGFHTASDLEILWVLQDGICAAPHCKRLLIESCSTDHIEPLSKGGSNWPDNLQLLCVPCNCEKKDRNMKEWLDARRA